MCIRDRVFSALQNIVPSHLADQNFFDFRGLTLDSDVEEGDIVFDTAEMPLAGTIPLQLAL